MSEHRQPRPTPGQEGDTREESDEVRDNLGIPPLRQAMSTSTTAAATTSPASTFRVPQSSIRSDRSTEKSPIQRSPLPFDPPSRLNSGGIQFGGPGTSSNSSSSTPSTSSSNSGRLPFEHTWRAPPSSAITGLGMPAPPDLPRSGSISSSFTSPSLAPFRTTSADRVLPSSSNPAPESSSKRLSIDDEKTFSTEKRSLNASAVAITAEPSSVYPRPSYTSSFNNPSESVRLPKASIPSTAESRQRPTVDGFSRTRNGWTYRLIVVQHPTRARMCGFGDKDRRPLSPTLIVKLVITEESTGKVISPWDVNTSLFFLASDLCHPDELILSPRNVLVHQHAASVPTAVLQQQQQQRQRQRQQLQQQQQQKGSEAEYESSIARQQQYTTPYSGYSSSYNTPGHASTSTSSGIPLDQSHQASSSTSKSYSDADVSLQKSHQSTSGVTTFTTEHYTRNLVGAAVTGANVLRDEQDVYTIFFVLQDLSIRTEGVYRIRLIFTDLAKQDGTTNEGVSEALAEIYTEPFSVYSPRRFPGMLEPTELSKKLASQGIKIAVRSDKKKRRRESAERETQTGGDTEAAIDAAEEDEE